MVDHKNVIFCLLSNFNIVIGLITLNNLAIFIGILSGLSVIGSNVFGNYLKWKEYKRNKEDVDRTTK